MIRHPLHLAALPACLAAGLMLTLSATAAQAGSLSIAPLADGLATTDRLQAVAEKKATKSDGGAKKVQTKKAEPAQRTAPAKKQSTGGQSSGGGSSGGGQSSSGGSQSGGTKTKTTGTTDRSPQPSGSSNVTLGQPSKTKSPPPDAAGKQPVKQERILGETPRLDDSLGLKPLPKTKDEAATDKGQLPEIDPDASEGTTYTTQDVTPEELDQIAAENEDINDTDGDGDYEFTHGLNDNAEVNVEDGVAYIDNDGDGTVDFVVPADHYDAENNAVHLPVSPETVNQSEEGYVDMDSDTVGYVWYDSDGDGVDELYQGQDTDGDGVADVVDLTHEQGGEHSREELEEAIANTGASVFDVPEATGGGDDQDGKGFRPKVRVNVAVAPSTTAVAAPAAANTGANELVVSLQQLKLLHDQNVLTATEYENAQLRALADIDPNGGNIEGGLTLLRDLWQRQLITESPYANKRRELLDAL